LNGLQHGWARGAKPQHLGWTDLLQTFSTYNQDIEIIEL
jgi:hypothetical protein